MNIAFQALVFLLLILPGFLVRHSYNGKIGQLTYPENFSPIGRESVKIIFCGMLLHSMWLPLSNSLSLFFIDEGVNYDVALYFLIGDYSDGTKLNTGISSIVNHKLQILIYFITLTFSSWLIGYCVHKFVRRYRLDFQYPFFMFNNRWHYYLSGEELKLEHTVQTLEADKEVAMIMISALVETGDGPVLYFGKLEEYFLDNKGSLQQIVLENVNRRKLENDRDMQSKKPQSTSPRFYPIGGHYFILRSDRIINLNVHYMVVKKKK